MNLATNESAAQAIIISDNSIIAQNISDNYNLPIRLVNINYPELSSASGVTGNSADWQNFITSFQQIDLLIIDQNIKSDLIPIYRVKTLVNFTDNFFSPHEIKLLKPFKLTELLNIVSTVLNNNSFFGYLQDDLIYDEQSATLNFPDNKIKLTAKENKILAALLVNKNYELTKEQLRSNIWQYNKDHVSSTIDITLYKLKSKLPAGLLEIKNGSCCLKIKHT